MTEREDRIWISTDSNESDTGTKCQNPVAFYRTSQMLKGYAPMYIPTEYNPKRINLNGVMVSPSTLLPTLRTNPPLDQLQLEGVCRRTYTSTIYFYRRYRFSSL
eukprot:COSAG01_NODE_3232_length_6376_cov_69.680899_1_plen_104_part_00